MRPWVFAMLTAIAIGLAAVAGTAAVLVIGREVVLERTFGPPDLGPYDFSKPTRTGKLNDALACPLGACPGAGPTFPVPVFAVEPAALFGAVRDTLTADGVSRIVSEDANAGRLRVVARTPVFRFADTVSVEVTSPSPGTATFSAYSRSQIGHFDLGTNAARLRGLIDRLDAVLPRAG